MTDCFGQRGAGLSLAVAVMVGADGLAPLLAFFLGGFAGGAAGRQLVLATRRQGLRGLVGRANGGMLVHIGVILIAVALAASNSYTHSATLTIGRGETVEWSGHSFEFVGVSTEVTARADVVMADVLLDDTKVYAPAVTTYLQQGMTVPTPSVRTGWTSDVYLTIDGNDPPATDADEVVLRVFVKPMVLWLWIGGAVMAIGTVLSALPSRRSRRPTDPTSALITSGQHV